MKEASEKLKDNYYILDRVKNYINNGVYTPLPQYTTEIYQKIDGQKIQKLAQKVFAEDQVELVMKPTEPTDGK
jgi:tyrosine-protein phosphatase YwqE